MVEQHLNKIFRCSLYFCFYTEYAKTTLTKFQIYATKEKYKCYYSKSNINYEVFFGYFIHCNS